MNRKQNRTIFSALILLAFFQASAQNIDSATIQSITITRADAFSDTTKAILRTANSLHPITKEKVIRRQLLLKEGDLLDMELVDETERALRRLAYLEDVEIELDTNARGVDIIINTHDAWSLLLVGDFGTGGGLTTLGLGIEEYNFLGQGKHFMIYNEWQSDIGSTWDFIYEDPQLFGSQWKAYLDYTTGAVNNDFSVSIERPYFSSDSKWDVSGGYVSLDQIDRLFDKGKETSRQKNTEKSFEVDVNRRFGKRYKKFSFGLGYDHTDMRFAEIEGQTTTPLPADELINRIGLSFTKENLKFASDIRIRKMGIKEDIELGPTFSLGLAKAGVFGSGGVNRWEYYFYYNHELKFGSGTYLNLSAGFTTKQTRDEIYSAGIQFYSRITDHQTLAINIETTFSDNLQQGKQFILGGESGLRGYPARFVGGDALFLTNIEDRIFTGLQFLGMELGGVAFFDIGYVWKKDAPVLFEDLLPSVGIGIRICMFAYPEASIIRIDYGFPLTDNKPIIAIGFGQQF